MGPETDKGLFVGVNEMKKYKIQKGIFHRTAEELKEFNKENNIKLLKLLKYLIRRNDKKIQKGDK